ncbi:MULTISPECIES: RidA family protein [unclassified Beijerinckia]|uniref:RidA family protein n=1 Tax=unclassified Beijerinckia TaxID=2638183 RepID=UPI0008982436|nr:MULTISPECIES: RidA family protein [unclassified Beijerinckia]MDH7799324.1 enamine deaminase RidA (YjgF/YER057c/UK114 family) [Beijerinckia sp. GAS462]SED46270.1 Enamine deaminase RidA, house cleaning of reactive enamine intermediates, YjgF/YER057c/UK114 family [Beijerinckia sp. 28-YEA-48]
MKSAARLALGTCVAALLTVSLAAQAEVIRKSVPNAPIASSVQVSGNVTTYYLSGQVPSIANKDADPRSPQAYGDVEAQTVSILEKIKASLEGYGLTMGDVVKMQVYLVHTDKTPMDFKGFSQGYSKFFGGSQPNLPARSTMGVSALVNPGWLVEIEVTAAKVSK